MAGISSYSSFGAPVVDSASWLGVRGDGTTDNTVALQKAVDRLAAAGGGTVLLPGGVVIGAPEGDNRVKLRGQHRDATILRRPATYDGPALAPKNWSTLRYAGVDGSVGGMGAEELTIDGNRSAGGFTVPVTNTPPTLTATPSTSGGTLAAATYTYQVSAGTIHGHAPASTRTTATTTGSAGSVALSCTSVSGATRYYWWGRDFTNGIKLLAITTTTTYTDTGAVSTTNSSQPRPYFSANTSGPAAFVCWGYRQDVHNVRVINAPGAGVHFFWPGNNPPSGQGDAMEAQMSRLFIEKSGTNNLVWEGAHDSILMSLTAANCGQATGTTTDNVIVENGGPIRMYGAHAWGQARNGFALWGQADLYDFQAEGALGAQVLASCDDVHLIGGEVFYPGGAGAKGLQMGTALFSTPNMTAIGIHAYGFSGFGAAIDLQYMGDACVVEGIVDDGTITTAPAGSLKSSRINITAPNGTGITTIANAVRILDTNGNTAITMSPASGGALGFGGDANPSVARIVAGAVDNAKAAEVLFEVSGQTAPVWKTTDSGFADKTWTFPGTKDGFGIRGNLEVRGEIHRALKAAITTTSTTIVDATGLMGPTLQPGDYEFEADLLYQSSITTGGPRFAIGGGATVTMYDFEVEFATSTTARTTTIGTAFNTGYGTSPGTASTTFKAKVKGLITVTTAGTVGLRWLMSASGTGTLRPGSIVKIRRVTALS